MPNKHAIVQLIKNEALALGFDVCGIAPAHELTSDVTHLNHWLQNGYHAEMQYMDNHFEKRVNPKLLVEGSKSVIVVLLNYFPPKDPFQNSEIKIAKYAFGADYHEVIRQKLFSLLNFINNSITPVNGRAFVDSAPVLEKAWAREAGLGWISKNSLLINRQLGSFCFIGELIVDIELEYDQPVTKNYCGNCQRCIEACPTHAIIEPGVIDSHKCLSYNTIENKGEIPAEILTNNKGWIFGCDICQDVCPWNSKCKPHHVDEFSIIEPIATINKEELQKLTEKEFKNKFRHSPINRSGFKGILRNIS